MSDHREQTPYKRFESFLKRLVAVPKAEIDEQATAQKQRGRPASSNEHRRMNERAR